MLAQVQPIVSEGQKMSILLNYGHLIGLSILYWDHLISLNAEINFLWRHNKSLSAYWFYINRYFGFFSGIAVSGLPFLTLSLEACIHYTFFREVVLVVAQVITGVIMIIRVYALYGRNRRILWFLFGIGGVWWE
ncbi:hypothetical protein B0H13DRAFT_2345197 [Mycena leptocephala]|nr:hypothetical protein B0H13DRAFT_2345197 [Mycena leptocephala]